MKLATNDPTSEYFIPTFEWINNLKVGDLVPNCFGNLNPITEIHARGTDINGRLYICLYTQYHENSTISGSFKEGELHRSVKLCGKHTSHELNIIESYGV